MRLATSDERDLIFGFSPELFRRLDHLRASGASLDDLIIHLRQSAVPMPAAVVALRKMDAVSDLSKARNAVDSSAAYAKWPEHDDAYPEIYKLQSADAA